MWRTETTEKNGAKLKSHMSRKIKMKIMKSTIIIICFLLSLMVDGQNKVNFKSGGGSYSNSDKNGVLLPGVLMPLIPDSPVEIEIPINNDKPILTFDSIPLKYIKKYDNEIEMVEYLHPESKGDTIFMKITGKFTFLTDMLSGKMEFTFQNHPTKIDITVLRETQQQLKFKNYRIFPNPKGNSFLILDWDNILVINAKLTDPSRKVAVKKNSKKVKK